MDAILEPLVRSPRLFQYLEELEKLAREERARREEFYELITPDVKWEFINGEIIMDSPAKARHIEVRERIARLLGTHVTLRNSGWTGGEKALICLTRNDYEPDIVYFAKERAVAIQSDTEKFPAPDFALEVISHSTEKRDRGIKFTDYAAHGVGEYWIVDPVAETIEQYLLGSGDSYDLAAKQTDGTLRSRVIEGFTFPVRAAFDDGESLAALWALKPA